MREETKHRIGILCAILVAISILLLSVGIIGLGICYAWEFSFWYRIWTTVTVTSLGILLVFILPALIILW